ncbi:hypothetical protein SUGI_0791490 [Cryptomeria japonica]|uniref:leucine-rich repeat extensin-like protein 5 isoform X1 n=2 Tax=Cryptomeria japonica TaxID=3369 RepID=UPI0024146A31|nr:leucine-rich repeat extensin-like protein 5 isoform X1 [Cryptomeria japonica]GLJ38836.1 hypothetical protein SUGI_0791490 [Cryptomeria japonica]
MAGTQDRSSLSTMKIQMTLISVSTMRNMRNVDIFPNSKVYAVAWIEDGSRPAKQKTRAKEYGVNPTWNKLMSFMVDEEALGQNRLRLKLELRMKETNGSKKEGRMKKTTSGKKLGDASIPIKFLGQFKTGRVDFKSYRVRNSSGNITGKLNLTLQVIKPESESNVKESAPPQRKKRKSYKVPLIKPESKSNAKESAAQKPKKRNKVPLPTSTEFALPTIDPLPLPLPLPPHPHVGYPQYPLQQPYPHQGGPGYTPSSGYPSYPPDYHQQAGYPHQGGPGYTPSGYPSYPPDHPQAAYPPHPIDYPQQAGYPYPPYPPYIPQDYPQQVGYPYPPYPQYTPPDYPQQAGYPYPYPPCPPYTPQAAAPPPPPPLSHAGYLQYPTPGEQYAPQQPYPQQGEFTANSGYSGW